MPVSTKSFLCIVSNIIKNIRPIIPNKDMIETMFKMPIPNPFTEDRPSKRCPADTAVVTAMIDAVFIIIIYFLIPFEKEEC